MVPKTVAMDFDGVIHSYRSGWQGATIAQDEPTTGIREAIEKLRQDYRVVVVSSRCLHKGGRRTIKRYLGKHGIEVDEITGKKVPALAYIDDRAIMFYGDAASLPGQVNTLRTWWELENEGLGGGVGG